MVDVARIARLVGRLRTMPFFPADEDSHKEIVKLICDMVTEESQAEWLITRFKQLYGKWSGEKELRSLFCKRYRPADGIEALSEVYADDDILPPERPAIAAPEFVKLPPLPEVGSDPETEKSTAETAAKHRLPATPALNRLERIARIKTAPLVTQEEIDQIKAIQDAHRTQSEPAKPEPAKEKRRRHRPRPRKSSDT